MTELELAAVAKKAVIDAHTDRYIVHACFGAKGATVLAPTGRKLKKGELVLVDCGCVHRAYIGDMARVYAYGEPPPDAVRVHEAMDRVNATIVASIRPGLKASELYSIGAAAMKSGGLELSLEFAGHGIGLDVHEPPSWSPTITRFCVPTWSSSSRWRRGGPMRSIIRIVRARGCGRGRLRLSRAG